MARENYYKRLFQIGSLWNFSVCLILLFLIWIGVNVWDLFGILKPNSMIWLEGFLLFVGCFGIGYYGVSRNINENHYSVLLGIVAKCCVFILCLVYLIKGDVGFMVFLLGCGDLTFAGLFAEFLIKNKK